MEWPSTEVILAGLSALTFTVDVIRRTFAAYGTLVRERGEALVRVEELTTQLADCSTRRAELQKQCDNLQHRLDIQTASLKKPRRKWGLRLW
jgi:chromosome segregation ATPase